MLQNGVLLQVLQQLTEVKRKKNVVTSATVVTQNLLQNIAVCSLGGQNMDTLWTHNRQMETKYGQM